MAKKRPYESRPTDFYWREVVKYLDPDNQKQVGKKAKRRKGKIDKSIDSFVWGSGVESKKDAGETRALEKADVAEARNLLHKMVIDHIRRAKGPGVAKHYEANPDDVQTYVDGLIAKTGIDYDRLIGELTSLGPGGDLDNLTENENTALYKTMVALAQEELAETKRYRRASTALQREPEKHHENVRHKFHEETGLRPKHSQTIGHILDYLEEHIRQNQKYSKEFLKTQGRNFHQKTVDTYKSQHYKKAA